MAKVWEDASVRKGRKIPYGSLGKKRLSIKNGKLIMNAISLLKEFYDEKKAQRFEVKIRRLPALQSHIFTEAG